MFESVSTTHYGRCLKHQYNWYIDSVGINRLYYVHSGNVTVLLDNIPHELKAGYIYLLPQNLKFEPVLNDQTFVDHTFLDFFSLPAIKMDTFLEIEPSKYPFIEKAGHILFELAEAYQTYPSMVRNDYSDLVESYLKNILFLIDRQFPINTISDSRINLVLDYIHKNYEKKITLEQLIDIANLEKNYFIRMFKQYMNVTPYQYIKKYRFNIALTMLKRKQSISSTALHIGYSDIASFSHAFKKIFGIYPSEIEKFSE